VNIIAGAVQTAPKNQFQKSQKAYLVDLLHRQPAFLRHILQKLGGRIAQLSCGQRHPARHTRPTRARAAAVPVLCRELRLDVLPGLLAFVDGLLININTRNDCYMNVRGVGFVTAFAQCAVQKMWLCLPCSPADVGAGDLWYPLPSTIPVGHLALQRHGGCTRQLALWRMVNGQQEGRRAPWTVIQIRRRPTLESIQGPSDIGKM
jgi:hypothetical protein